MVKTDFTILKKAVLANIVGAIVILASLFYGIKENNVEIIMLCLGSAVAYFYGRYQQQRQG